MSSVLLLASFTVPVYLFLAAHAPAVPPRKSPPVIADAGVASIPVGSYRDAVPVLVYHDIASRPGRYTVSPRAFAEQMATLRKSGFHTISAAQLIAFLHGRGALPNRPVILTFDDGLGSAWRVADPILAKYGFRAVDFVISGQLGHHGFYYLHPAEVRAMVRSGRWDIEAHTHLAHLYLQVDRRGDFGPALTNRAWRAHQRRIETIAEFTRRIRRDLDLNIEELRRLGASPQLFAYPFSASRTPTNDPRVVPILHALVGRRFAISFVDGDGGRFLSRYDEADMQQLPRLEVYHDTSATVLVDRIRDLAPLSPRIANALDDPRQWVYEGGRGVDHQGLLRRDTLSLRAPVRHWLAAYWAPDRSALWRAYRAWVTLGGLGREGSGTSAVLLIGARRVDRYAVTVSAGRISMERLPIQGPTRLLKRARLRPSASHRLEVEFADSRLRVTVDGRSRFTIAVTGETHGGIGLGGWRARAASPQPTVTRLSLAPLGQDG